MKVDLAYRVEKTQLSPRRCLLPLFEAIVNSMQAIEEAKRASGQVTISIVRDTKQRALSAAITPSQPITGFVVEDNGSGFTKGNYEAFDTEYTPHKRSQGGKGIGRFLWLKAFKKAEVDSTYPQNGHFNRRTFDFTISGGGIGKHRQQSKARAQDAKTIVRLIDFLPDYRTACPTNAEVIGRRIISHLLGYFLLENCPQITLKDDYEDTCISLNREFEEKMRLSRKPTHFQLEGQTFHLEHLCLASTAQSGHELHLCAQSRSVETEPLSDLIPALRGPLHNEEGKAFFYTPLLASPLLDQSVDWNRTRLDLPDERELHGEQELTRQAIVRKVVEKADSFLNDYLKPLREKNNRRIIEYIQQKAPKYRPLAKHRSAWFDRIAPSITDDALNLELYKLSREYDRELEVLSRKAKRAMKTEDSIKGHKDKFSEFLTEWNDQGIAKLADYVIHRKATLDFLAESISLLPNGKYPGEDQIHGIVCPLKTTSDDVPLEQMNLWIVDERLAYHHYLASDQPFGKLKPIVVPSDDRPDIITFTHACAFADKAFQSIVIVEFKRPMRNDYTEKENPITQVFRYVDHIRSGKALDRNGRPIPVTPSTPIYAYIVCDFTDKLKKFAKDRMFTLTPDGQGYFNFHSEYLVYTEMISFNKLLADAQQRNAAFFDRLRLPLEP